jgi:hypothetical protein
MGVIKWKEDTIARFEKEGRGMGTGANYIPWIKVSDFHSDGNSRRVWSDLTRRVHELLSNIEFYLFLWLEWSGNTVDIREGFPLDRRVTSEVARQLRIRHPSYPTTNVLTVMTVDFFVTMEHKGERKHIAFSAKDDSAMEDENELSKLEIIRETLEKLGVEHFLILKSNLPMEPINNMIWIRGASLKSGEIEPWTGAFDDLAISMQAGIQSANQTMALNEYCTNFDQNQGQPGGTGLRVARLLMQKKWLLPPMYKPDLESVAVGEFRISALNI